jgi:FkbM family methyltransferase
MTQLPNGLWLRTSGLTEAEYAAALGDVKEPHTVAFLQRIVTSDMACIDVGANIGYFSVLLARQARYVHAFEPTPALVQRIRDNAALNGLANLVVHPVAVSDRLGEVALHLSPDDPEANSLYGDGPTVTVSMTTLDACDLPRIGLIKIDCEGSERAVIRGAAGLISRDRPLLIFECNVSALEAANCAVADLTTLVRSFGYTLSVIETLRPGVWNILGSRASFGLPAFTQ